MESLILTEFVTVREFELQLLKVENVPVMLGLPPNYLVPPYLYTKPLAPELWTTGGIMFRVQSCLALDGTIH